MIKKYYDSHAKWLGMACMNPTINKLKSIKNSMFIKNYTFRIFFKITVIFLLITFFSHVFCFSFLHHKFKYSSNNFSEKAIIKIN